MVVDTAIPSGLAPAEIDAWVRDRVARDLPMYELDRAALAALEPDLILTQDLCRVCALPAGTVEDACRLIGTDAEVLSVDPHTLDDVLHADRGDRPRGRGRVGRHRADRRAPGRLAAVERAVAGRTRPRVLVLEWTDPPFLAGHWVPELVSRAGGIPVAGAAGGRSVTSGWDELPDGRCRRRRAVRLRSGGGAGAERGRGGTAAGRAAGRDRLGALRRPAGTVPGGRRGGLGLGVPSRRRPGATAGPDRLGGGSGRQELVRTTSCWVARVIAT